MLCIQISVWNEFTPLHDWFITIRIVYSSIPLLIMLKFNSAHIVASEILYRNVWDFPCQQVDNRRCNWAHNVVIWSIPNWTRTPTYNPIRASFVTQRIMQSFKVRQTSVLAPPISRKGTKRNLLITSSWANNPGCISRAARLIAEGLWWIAASRIYAWPCMNHQTAIVIIHGYDFLDR